MKTIHTKGIGYLAPVEGSSVWYWGSDYTDGDLYEAEELWDAEHRVSSNRLIFVRYPEGILYEPIHAEEGQYFGKPVCDNGKICILLADFAAGMIRLLQWEEGKEPEEVIAFERSSVRDCYNLMPAVSPLCVIRQGHDNDFQIIWPERSEFEIAPSETFDTREGDRLIFAKWYEDPDYREEVIIRRYPDGEILSSEEGSRITMPDGSVWHLI